MFALVPEFASEGLHVNLYQSTWKNLRKLKCFFLLDICDENVGSMPYFVYPTPPAKQHRRIWVKKSHESTKVWYNENKAQHSETVSIFLV